MRRICLRLLRILLLLLLAASGALLLGRAMPPGDWLLIERDNTGIRDLVLADVAHALIHPLTRTPDLIEENAAWSPDGRQIAYVQQPYSALRRLCVRGIMGAGVCRLPRNLWDDYPRWSPDGTALLFESLDERTGMELYRTDGETTLQLTEAYGNDMQGYWSPDGQWFVFTSTRANAPHLYLASPAGGSALTLETLGVVVEEGVPSPDGQWVAYVTSERGRQSLNVLPTTCLPAPETCAAQARRLTEHEPPLTDVAWSPDGAQLAFVSMRHGNMEVYTLALATGAETRWTHSAGAEAAPQFSPDGSALVYGAIPATEYAVYIQPLRVGAAAWRLTPLGDGYDYWRPQWRP
jgi:Tol biopolymer transport system component